jgi:type IV secretory pathway VirB10-like protein
MAETPPIATGSAAPSAATVTDRRPVPRGVLPRGVQTWIMAGLAIGMLAIMLIVGRPDPPARPAAAGPSLQPPSADRVRDYQNRLQALEAQALQDSQPPAVAPGARPAASTAAYQEPKAPPAPDPIEADRKRREYESLFAGNVVLSRRPETERPDLGRSTPQTGTSARSESPSPSVDEVADAVVRASARTGALATGSREPLTQPLTPLQAIAAPTRPAEASRTPERTEAISAAGPLHRVLEGTVIDTVLTNRLDGTSAAPVNCLVTNALYSHSGLQVLIPAGARLLGETKPVQAFGETRLAVSFHRLLMPDGRTYRLDQFLGLNQIGDAGLRDRVNQHYLSTFGAAAAVGLINGLSQYLGSAGLGSGDGDRTVVIAGGVGDAASQSTGQVMNRFLNRLPTITIREGHRVKVYLTSDLDLPAYDASTLPPSF